MFLRWAVEKEYISVTQAIVESRGEMGREVLKPSHIVRHSVQRR